MENNLKIIYSIDFCLENRNNKLFILYSSYQSGGRVQNRTIYINAYKYILIQLNIH